MLLPVVILDLNFIITDMKAITSVIQGNESFLRERVCRACLETEKNSIIREFEKKFDSLEFEEQISFAIQLLRRSDLFY